MSTSAHRRDPHLGGLVAAVVDGVLDHQARDRALGHLARCDECRAEVDAQRRLKARLGQLGAPELSAGLAAHLLGIPEAAAVSRAGASNDPLVPGLPPVQLAASFRAPASRPAPSRRAGDRPAGERPAGDGPAGRPSRARRGQTARRRRVVGAAAGGFAAFALSLATVVALGSSDAPGAVAPAVDAYTVEHNRSAVSVPGADPLVEMVGLTTSLPR